MGRFWQRVGLAPESPGTALRSRATCARLNTRKSVMTVAALVTWCAAALAGLYLVAIWLIEYDRDYQRSVATRLPVTVVASHAVLAVGGLGLWVVNFVLRQSRITLAAVAVLAVVAVLGLIMALRWLKVYRTVPSREAIPVGGEGWAYRRQGPTPAERNFPVSVVIAHGVFAVTTVVLVTLTAFRF